MGYQFHVPLDSTLKNYSKIIHPLWFIKTPPTAPVSKRLETRDILHVTPTILTNSKAAGLCIHFSMIKKTQMIIDGPVPEKDRKYFELYVAANKHYLRMEKQPGDGISIVNFAKTKGVRRLGKDQRKAEIDERYRFVLPKHPDNSKVAALEGWSMSWCCRSRYGIGWSRFLFEEGCSPDQMGYQFHVPLDSTLKNYTGPTKAHCRENQNGVWLFDQSTPPTAPVSKRLETRDILHVTPTILTNSKAAGLCIHFSMIKKTQMIIDGPVPEKDRKYFELYVAANKHYLRMEKQPGDGISIVNFAKSKGVRRLGKNQRKAEIDERYRFVLPKHPDNSKGGRQDVGGDKTGGDKVGNDPEGADNSDNDDSLSSIEDPPTSSNTQPPLPQQPPPVVYQPGVVPSMVAPPPHYGPPHYPAYPPPVSGPPYPPAAIPYPPVGPHYPPPHAPTYPQAAGPPAVGPPYPPAAGPTYPPPAPYPPHYLPYGHHPPYQHHPAAPYQHPAYPVHAGYPTPPPHPSYPPPPAHPGYPAPPTQPPVMIPPEVQLQTPLSIPMLPHPSNQSPPPPSEPSLDTEEMATKVLARLLASEVVKEMLCNESGMQREESPKESPREPPRRYIGEDGDGGIDGGVECDIDGEGIDGIDGVSDHNDHDDSELKKLDDVVLEERRRSYERDRHGDRRRSRFYDTAEDSRTVSQKRILLKRPSQETSYQGSHIKESGYQGSGYQGSGYHGSRMKKGGYQGSGYHGSRMKKGGYQGSGYHGSRMKKGGYQGSGYHGSRMKKGGYQGSGYHGSRMKKGGYQGSGYQYSHIKEVSYQSSGYQGGSSKESGYKSSRMKEGDYHGTKYKESGYRGSSMKESSYNESGYEDSGYQDGSYHTRGYQGTRYEESGYQESGYQGNAASGYKRDNRGGDRIVMTVPGDSHADQFAHYNKKKRIVRHGF
eukprot:sb/3461779/